MQTKLFQTSRSRPEGNSRPKISRIDFDLTELEISEVWWGRPKPVVDFHTGRDGKLCDGKYPKASVDLVWTRVTGKNKKVPYETFLKLLDEIARAKGVERQVVDDYVLQHARPVISGTRGSSKFYDDKSNWTGVAKKGGPSNYNPVISLATLTNTGR